MHEYIVMVHIHYADAGLVKVMRAVDGMVTGRSVHLYHMPLLRTMGYLARHKATYCYYQENEHILVYRLKVNN